MAAQYMYARNGQQFGPVTAKDLRDLVARGQLAPTDLVWKEGLPEWVPAAKLKGLFEGSAPSQPALPPAAAPAAAQPAAAAPTGPTAKAGPAVLAGLRQGLDEVKAAAMATAAQTRRVVDAGKDKLTERRLRQEAQAAQAELGEALARAGQGDAALLAKLADVDGQILRLATNKASVRAAADERLSLQLRLAEPFLGQAPPPGFEAAHEKALAARQALDAHLAASAGARAVLLPGTRRDRVRVIVAVAAVLLLAVGVVFFLMRMGRRPTEGSGPGPVVQKGGEADEPSGPMPAPTGDETPPAGNDTPPPAGGSPAKEAARQRLAEAEAAYLQAQATYEAAHARYRMERDNALAQNGRRRAMGLPPLQPTMPDPRLQQDVLRAKAAFDQAKRAYDETK
jgi:hypothetical protein